MMTIQLRNLPESLYLAIKESAKASKRSMTQEAIVLISNGLNKSPEKQKSKEEIFNRLKELAAEKPLKIEFKQILEYIQEDRER